MEIKAKSKYNIGDIAYYVSFHEWWANKEKGLSIEEGKIIAVYVKEHRDSVAPKISYLFQGGEASNNIIDESYVITDLQIVNNFLPSKQKIDFKFKIGDHLFFIKMEKSDCDNYVIQLEKAEIQSIDVKFFKDDFDRDYYKKCYIVKSVFGGIEESEALTKEEMSSHLDKRFYK